MEKQDLMDQDYMPFGEDLPEVGQTEVLVMIVKDLQSVEGEDNHNLMTGLTGLTLIMEDGEYVSYTDMTSIESQHFTSEQLYSTKHMMFGINRNNKQELYIFSNKTNIGFTAGPDKRLQNIIKELGLTDVAKGDGGSTQWWLCNDFSLQYENRPLGNMILIRKGHKVKGTLLIKEMCRIY